MSIIKSFSVGNGDMCYIKHNSDNFTIIDCNINTGNAKGIIEEIKEQSAQKSITRFISTHPDEDHFGGIHLLDDEIKIHNFYVIKNKAIKKILQFHLRDTVPYVMIVIKLFIFLKDAHVNG